MRTNISQLERGEQTWQQDMNAQLLLAHYEGIEVAGR